MNNLHPFGCCVIAPHIAAKVAGQSGGAQSEARTTLNRMRQLAAQRTRMTTAAIRPATPSPSSFSKRCSVFDAQERVKLPGTLVSSEKKSTTDPAAREAFDGARAMLDFLADVFGRNALDDKGTRITSSVHYGQRFGNAMWNGRQVVYGDGDGRYFHRFTASLDVTAHELMHAVIQHTAALGYTGETGALNEHLCDAFGLMAKQYAKKLSVLKSDWLIGSELIGPVLKPHAQAIRSMAAPGTAYDDPLLGKDPQPSHMRDYVETDDDNGGVHINSGIPNHAFYLAAMEIGGNAWEELGQIWYVALTSRLKRNAGFRDLARATVDLAGEMFGNGGRVQRIVSAAWGKVGLFTPVLLPRAVQDDPRKARRRVLRAAKFKWRRIPKSWKESVR